MNLPMMSCMTRIRRRAEESDEGAHLKINGFSLCESFLEFADDHIRAPIEYVEIRDAIFGKEWTSHSSMEPVE